MATYTAIPSGDRDPDSPLTTGLVNKIVDNPIAISEGAAGAPKILQAAIDTGAVSQAKLKTATGNVTHTTTVGVNFTLPGGAFGFYVQIKGSDSLATKELIAQMGDPDGTSVSTSLITNIFLRVEGTPQTITAEQGYIQASPPYDLGDGEIPLFIFVMLDSGGNIIGGYAAPEAPWHYNGPTNIKADRSTADGRSFKNVKDLAEIDAALVAAGHPAGLTLRTSKELSILVFEDYIDAFRTSKNIEIEIDQAIKNADIALIPRPMNPAPGNTVVMLDPVSDLTIRLAELREHEDFSLLQLLHDGDLLVSNTVLNRAGPPGVDVVSYRFR